MSPGTRRRILRYGIAIDLAIVATGIGMLFPSPWLIAALFFAATAASQWKGGRNAGALALGVCLLLAIVAFPTETRTMPLLLFVMASVFLLLLPSLFEFLAARRRSTSTSEEESVTLAPVEQLQSFREESDRSRRDAEEKQQKEGARRDEERQRVEAAQRAEIERRAAEERRIEMERRAEEERRIEIERRAEEERRIEIERRAAEERRIEMERRAEEERRLEAERRAEVERRQEMDRRAEAERLEVARIEKEAIEREEEVLQLAAQQLAESAAEPPPGMPSPVFPTPTAPTTEPAAQQPITMKPLARSAPLPRRPAVPVKRRSFFDRIAGWFAIGERRTVNLVNRRVNDAAPAPAPRSEPRPAGPQPRSPRVLMVERRRATADTIVPRMRLRGVEIEVVERWVDAVDEMFRFKPDTLFIDVEHPEFDLIRRTIIEQNSKMPLVFTGSASSSPPPALRHAPWVVRPYDVEELTRIARQAMVRAVDSPASPVLQIGPRPESQHYEVTCFTCRTAFNAIDADWCSCLTRDRTIVCTNCLTCFCRTSAAYKERFWIDAPPRLFDRRNADAEKFEESLVENLPSQDVRRPLVLCVAGDSQIRAIVSKTSTRLGYGSIVAADAREGMALARDYRPNLILSDAFMPDMDGREMCRLLKAELGAARCRMVVMTGLYADTKYRGEAMRRFLVDEYVAKPVAVTDLINLLQKHLEGVAEIPVQLRGAEASSPREAAGAEDEYNVSCFRCENLFDVTNAEWCQCDSDDNTLVCPHCKSCFCEAPVSYKDRFWLDAPSSLFERKMIGSRRSDGAGANPPRTEARRPLVLLVEEDENVRLIVRTVVTNMGFGFIVGGNGQEGLVLAGEYKPELVLSDAFMPNLDGREMCRRLKQDPHTSQAKAIIMTGLYSDSKYRNEALSHFKVDDYVQKPLAVDELIKVLKKYLPNAVSAVN